MSANVIWLSVAVLAVLGFVLGAGLAYAARVFAVIRDPRIDAVLAELPGANCGACGYPGCSGYAEALVSGSAMMTGCPVARKESWLRIADILGQGEEVDISVSKRVAAVKCCGNDDASAKMFRYSGLVDCRAAARFYDGPLQCPHGCLGLGTCVRSCPFGAITLHSSGVPAVDRNKCTGCGICIGVCPRQVMTLLPDRAGVQVLCNSGETARAVRQVCSSGCLKCRKCAKVCPSGAISFANGPAEIDPKLCTNCGLCIPECPVHCIYDLKQG